MNIQQRRLFFQAATSNQRTERSWYSMLNTCFRPCGWIAAILAALLLGCASLTPDRVNVLAGIAGQAAAVGAADWLAKHPEHRPAFDAAIAALVALHRNGNTNEDAFVELISSLPVNTLRGPDGELYVAGAGGLVVWDSHLQKGVAVKGEAIEPVMKATLVGLKRAMVPKPPAPVVARARRVDDLEGRAPEGAGSRPVTRGGPAYPLIGAATNNSVASTFDVSLNEYGIQHVNVKWPTGPGIYTVQRCDEGKPWEGYASVTNLGVWTTLWPAPVAVGTWRVVRR